jgi:hypothetical protein
VTGFASKREGLFMAGSGPGTWYSVEIARKELFLAQHPEWSIQHVRSRDVYEAVREDVSGETIIIDHRLGALMDRVENATNKATESAEGQDAEKSHENQEN